MPTFVSVHVLRITQGRFKRNARARVDNDATNLYLNQEHQNSSKLTGCEGDFACMVWQSI